MPMTSSMGEVKFLELIIDTFRMLQRTQWFILRPSLHRSRGYGSGVGQKGPSVDSRVNQESGYNEHLLRNQWKAVLFFPCVTHFLTAKHDEHQHVFKDTANIICPAFLHLVLEGAFGVVPSTWAPALLISLPTETNPNAY